MRYTGDVPGRRKDGSKIPVAKRVMSFRFGKKVGTGGRRRTEVNGSARALQTFPVKDQTVNSLGSVGHTCLSGSYSTVPLYPKKTQNLKLALVVFRQNLIYKNTLVRSRAIVCRPWGRTSGFRRWIVTRSCRAS